jgi:hypothetical protein
MSVPNAVAALIHDNLGKNLKDIFGKDFSGFKEYVGVFNKYVKFSETTKLLDQLKQVNTVKDEKENPKVTFGLVMDVVGSVPNFLDNLARAGGVPLFPLPILTDDPLKLKTLLKFFKEQNKIEQVLALIDIVKILDKDQEKNKEKKIEEIKKLFVNESFFSEKLQGIIGSETGAVLSLATIGIALEESPLKRKDEVPKEIEEALLDYFFKADGFETIDKSKIVTPVQLSNVVSTASDKLGSVFSRTTGEQYVRDITRIIVEAAYDTARDLGNIYKEVDAALKKLSSGEKISQKFSNWFKGFSSMAESAAMRSVEMATSGVSTFQTNSLIAAGAGTFAGTTARKLTQDCFLRVLKEELKL